MFHFIYLQLFDFRMCFFPLLDSRLPSYILLSFIHPLNIPYHPLNVFRQSSAHTYITYKYNHIL